ncbi:MAG: hypothetical protein U1E27_02785 [Kiritimatiellia bacterium]|nr:hypothetical protein [Kiritimatiellia bacterium]
MNSFYHQPSAERATKNDQPYRGVASPLKSAPSYIRKLRPSRRRRRKKIIFWSLLIALILVLSLTFYHASRSVFPDPSGPSASPLRTDWMNSGNQGPVLTP